MKVRTKIAVGFFCIAAIMVVQAAYLLSRLHHLEEINLSLTAIDFKIIDLEKQLLRTLQDQYSLDEKYQVRQDRDYLNALLEDEPLFRATSAQLKPLLGGAQEKSLFSKILESYDEYTATFVPPRELETLEKLGLIEKLKSRKHSLVLTISENLKQLIEASNQDIQAKLALVSGTTRKAGQIAFTVTASAIALSLILVFLIVRRLSVRFNKLTTGTVHISKGEFNHRIRIEGEDEFAQLSRAFNSMASRLAKIDEMKKEFISHVSHELKAPLASMREVNSLLLGGAMGPLNEKQEKLIKTSQQSGMKLTAMLNDLLDMSKIEGGVMDYKMEEGDLAELVHNCVREIEPICYERKITIDTQLDGATTRLRMDKMRINQVLSNLLSNATKFTSEGGKIRVSLQRVDSIDSILPKRFDRYRPPLNGSKKGYVLVSVGDTGTGIPEDLLDKIFERFYQVRANANSNVQGTGLGLAIARSIVQAHGGVIWAESASGQGSRFNFVLPA